MPRELGYLWRAYLRLRRRTGAGFAAAEPVSWLAIDAFIRRSGTSLAPWEVQLIERLDDIYLKPEPSVPMPEGQGVVAAASATDVDGVRSILGSVGVRRVVIAKKEA